MHTVIAQTFKSLKDLPHQGDAGQADIKKILTIVFTVLGMVAVLMVIIGGINFTGSRGDPAATAKARNTIIYALVGLAVAIFAVTIVQFTVGSLQ